MDQRISVLLKSPNPMIEQWISKMYDSAVKSGSKNQHSLKIALDSVKKYPLVIKSGSECAILKGFGKILCQIIDRKLKNDVPRITTMERTGNTQNNESVKRNGETDVNMEIDRKFSNTESIKTNTECSVMIEKNVNILSRESIKRRIEADEEKHTKKRKANYIPEYRTGPYAILIVLLQNYQHKVYSLSKTTLQNEAQLLCVESMLKPKPGSYYTAWSSINTLIKKGFVTKEKKKSIEYSLTDSGVKLAEMLATSGESNSNDFIFPKDNAAVIPSHSKPVNDNITDIISHQSDAIVIELEPNSFDVILLVDKQETSGKSKKNDATLLELEKYKMIKYELRHLKVGDFVWIARHRISQRELVLPHIVERKRMDDLGHSIKDGRFHEQKFRLKQCGVPHVIYLIENYGDNKHHTGLPLSSLKQAIANTRIQDGFVTHFTSSLGHSIKFLAMMTKLLQDKYKDKFLLELEEENQEQIANDNVIRLQEFNKFNSMASKNKALSVKDLFIKQLLQLKGLSVEKAVAITNLYPTPNCLMRAFDQAKDTSGNMLLADIRCGAKMTKVGSAISKTLHWFFTKPQLH